MTGRLLLVGGVDAAGQRVDVAVDGSSGLIEEVGTTQARPEDEIVDCAGMVLLASGVEPHAHLDKALSSRQVAAMPATLADAVRDWLALCPTLSREDYIERATESVEAMVRRGTTVVRTHVDVGTGPGLRAIEALVDVREAMRSRGLADIQVVALAAPPLGGDAGRENRYLLEAAVGAGIDVVGGSPDIDPDPAGAIAAAVAVAERAGLPLDLHSDQSVDPEMFWLPEFVRLVQERGLERAVASHCVSLASQSVEVQHRTAATLADAGVAVTTMPLTSLFYFGWDQPVAPPRGLTSIRILQEAGVTVAAGGDNVRDLFFALGRFDAFETASVLSMAAHLTPAQAWEMCTAEGRRALGLPPVGLVAGSPADLMAVAGASLNEVVAGASEDRIVLRRGRIVARTRVSGGLV